MNYFVGCRDLKSARKVYIELCKKHHPDKGGDVAIMQEINKQFDDFKKTGKAYSYSTFGRGWADPYTDAAWADLNEQLKKGRTFWKAQAFYRDGWNEDIEREANRKEKEEKENLKARMEKLKDEVAYKKASAVAEKIYLEINRQIRENFALGRIKQMDSYAMNEYLSKENLTAILKGNV